MARKGVLIGLLVAVLAGTALADGFEPYLADFQGRKIEGPIQEGSTIYVAVKGSGRFCGMDKFKGDILIFDFKTGAYIVVQDDPATAEFEGAWFRELGGPGTGLFFWVAGENSYTKVRVQLGSRLTFAGLGTALAGYLTDLLVGSGAFLPYTHWTGMIETAPAGYGTYESSLLPVVPWLPFWSEGHWSYVDRAFPAFGRLDDDDWWSTELPSTRSVDRVTLFPELDAGEFGFDFEDTETELYPYRGVLTLGRFENNDTVILIVRDLSDPQRKTIDQYQIKIKDTVSKLTVTPAYTDYGCPSCPNITIRVEDADENLNPAEVDYVPVFVILNPGSWNPEPYQTPSQSPVSATVNNFCSLLRYGGNYYVGVDDSFFSPEWVAAQLGGEPLASLMAPVRWYNIYMDRWINYEPAIEASWFDAGWVDFTGESYMVRAVIFVPETGPNTGVFELGLGNLEDVQQLLWGHSGARNYKLEELTTFSWYYIDPNDFDDMDLGVMRVTRTDPTVRRDYSETWITDPMGQLPVSTVRLGWDGLYVRVWDASANLEPCCCDEVVIHICDPHNEDDSEYIVINETAPNNGIFFSQGGIPLEPVWDAVGGYQLVFDNWNLEAFNEDTFFVQYNSLFYTRESKNALGDADPNDPFFPPQIDYAAGGDYWDVSFAKARVFDTQVFDGTIHDMWFVDCAGNKITGQLPVGAQIGLAVRDPDQDENPRLRETIRPDWNRGANGRVDSEPLWGSNFPALFGGDPHANLPLGILAHFIGVGTQTESGLPYYTYRGLDDEAGNLADGNSITGALPTVKVFLFNARTGDWEALTLRETGPNTGIFRSTTCIPLAASPVYGGQPGQGNLGARSGDTIMAFYQDPSNHSDISIISAKIGLGGAGGITPPAAPQVAFDRASYNTGDTVRITVTDVEYGGADVITGTAPVLVLKKADGTVIQSWNTINVVPGQPGTFRVEHRLLPTVTGTIIAVYTDPMIATRTVQAQATVGAPVMTGVERVVPEPDVLVTTTTFRVYPIPAGAVASRFKITVYDLTGKKVWEDTKSNTNEIAWNGGTLRNGAYIYVYEVSWPGGSKSDKGFVYIKR